MFNLSVFFMEQSFSRRFPERQGIYCVRWILSYLSDLSIEQFDEREIKCLNEAIDALNFLIDPDYLSF